MSDDEPDTYTVEGVWCVDRLTHREAELAEAYIQGLRNGEDRAGVMDTHLREVGEEAEDE